MQSRFLDTACQRACAIVSFHQATGSAGSHSMLALMHPRHPVRHSPRDLISPSSCGTVPLHMHHCTNAHEGRLSKRDTPRLGAVMPTRYHYDCELLSVVTP